MGVTSEVGYLRSSVGRCTDGEFTFDFGHSRASCEIKRFWIGRAVEVARPTFEMAWLAGSQKCRVFEGKPEG